MTPNDPPTSSEPGRYLLFGGPASRRIADLVGAFDSLLEAAAQVPDEWVGWAHVYKIKDGIVVAKAWRRQKTAHSTAWEEAPTDLRI